jgi:hypothetical protein
MKRDHWEMPFDMDNSVVHDVNNPLVATSLKEGTLKK